MFVALATAFTLYVFGPNAGAQWGVIDDHQTMHYLGEDGALRLAEVPTVLFNETEIGHFGTSVRYRPAYSFLRLVETSVFGLNVQAWYALRAVIFIFFYCVVAWLLFVYADFLAALLFPPLLFSQYYWSDIFARLGPGEAWTVFGAALFCLGAHRLHRSDTTASRLGLWLTVLGSMIAVGSKENFLILALPLAYFAYRFRSDKIAVATLALGFAFAGIVGVAIVLALAASGADIYGQSVAASSRLSTFVAFVSKQSTLLTITTAIVAGVALRLAGSQRRSPEWLPTLRSAFWVVAVAVVILLSQAVFYNGELPSRTRNDFPGIFVYELAILWVVHSLLASLSASKNYRLVGQGAFAVFALVVLGYVANRAPEIRVRAERNAATTQRFSTNLTTLVATAKGSPGVPLVLETHGPWNYEPIISVTRFLRANSVRNPIAVRLNGFSSATVADEFKSSLAAKMEVMSADGNEQFVPLADATSAPKCFSVGFQGTTSNSCEFAVKIW